MSTRLVAGFKWLLAVLVFSAAGVHAENNGAPIANQASVSYLDAANGAHTKVSNTVTAMPPPQIGYFHDAAYARRATSTAGGAPLYVQAAAMACDTDPAAIEAVSITINSTLTGDSETFTGIESAPNSGAFRIDGGVRTRTAELSMVQRGDGWLAVHKDDVLTAWIAGCGAVMSSTTILIDPSGVVYDSRSNAPIAGARVTLIDIDGRGNGGNPGAPAVVYAYDGMTAAPSSVVTGADGRYEFTLVAPSSYRLQVVAPSAYTFPSAVEPGDQPAGRILNLYGSFGGAFQVNESTGPVTLDLPVDTGGSGLQVDKVASRAVVEIADFVDYTVTLRNTGASALSGVTVADILPPGFSYQAGSTRMNGAKADEPAGGRGPTLSFNVGQLGVRAVAILSYRLRVGAGAVMGDGVNRAQASSVLPRLVSNVASAKVSVQGGVFSNRAIILGSVYANCRPDQQRGDGDAGIPGVRIYLEDGSYAITDGEGKYSFANVRPGTHVVKLEYASLPAGATLEALSQRNAGDAGSRFANLQDGELHKADFAVAGCSEALLKEVAARKKLQDKAVNTNSMFNVVKTAAPANAGATTATVSPVAAAAAAAIAEPESAGMDTLDNTLDFVGLGDGAVLPAAQATVRVKGQAGAQMRLTVNGVAVADSQVGRRMSQAERKLTVLDYIGIKLQAGANTLELSQFDAFGNPRGSRRISVIAPDRLARMVIAAIDAPAAGVPADGKTLARFRLKLEDAKGVAIAARTAVTLEASVGKFQAIDLDKDEPGVQLFVDGGSAEFALMAPLAAGEGLVRVTSANVKSEAKVRFVPELRPLMAAGVLESVVHLGGDKGSELTRDGFDAELQSAAHSFNSGKMDIAARSAVFVKGAVHEDYLLTVAYDSSRELSEKLQRDIDPNNPYLGYGDSATKGFDAQSTGHLFARIDRNQSSVLYGDFTTPGATTARSLGAYGRTLNGLRQHYQTDTVVVDTFASRASTRQIVELIAANGTSGPFLISQGHMLANSERVEIITRDRNQAGLIVKSVDLVRFTDYEVDTVNGRLLLRAPVASLDGDLNPVSLRVSYEVDQGGVQFLVAGAAGQVKLGDHVEVGGSVIEDRNPQDPASLASVNGTIRLDDKNSAVVELAQMDKASSGKGRAARIDTNVSVAGIDARLFAGRAEIGFDNPVSNLSKGRAESGIRLGYDIDPRSRLQAEVLHTGDLATGAARDGAQLTVAHTFDNTLRVEAGLRRAHETAAAGVTLAQPDITSARLKVGRAVPGMPHASVFIEAEQDVRDSGRRMLALGGEYQLKNGGRLYGRHELISSLGSNYALNDTLQRNATVFGIDTEYMAGGKVFSEYRVRSALSEREAEAAIGLRNRWAVAEGVVVNTSFERVQVVAGSAQNQSMAVTGAVEYTRDPRWKGTARLELRHGEQSDGLLNTLGLAYKIDEYWTALGKSTVALTRNTQLGSSKTDAQAQTGVAYRALRTLGWNGLGKYEYKREQDTGPLDTRRIAHVLSAQANYQPSVVTVLSGRYAVKRVLEQSLGLVSSGVTQLVGLRATREVGKRWDVSLGAQMLLDAGGGARKHSVGAELGYLLQKNLTVAAGYNATGFHERDLSAGNATAKGLYLRMRFKFDERGIESLLKPQ